MWNIWRSEEHFALTTKQILCGNKNIISQHWVLAPRLSDGFILSAYIVWLPPENMMRSSSCTHWIVCEIPWTGQTCFFDRSSSALPMRMRLIWLANTSFPWSCPEPALQHLSVLTVNSPARRCMLIKSHWAGNSLETKTSQSCWN